MKKRLWLMIVTTLALTACNNNKKPGDTGNASPGKTNSDIRDSCKIACEDTAIIKAWKILFADIPDTLKSTQPKSFRKPVDPVLAEGCIEKYYTTIRGHDINAIRAAYTQYVKHNSKELGDWLIRMTNDYNTTDVRMYLGIYTPEFVSSYKPHLSSEHVGRLTIFLWPYDKDNKPATLNNNSTVQAHPFNLGDLKPPRVDAVPSPAK